MKKSQKGADESTIILDYDYLKLSTDVLNQRACACVCGTVDVCSASKGQMKFYILKLWGFFCKFNDVRIKNREQC